MEYVEFTGKTVDDAITEACQKFTITSDRLEYEVVEKGTGGIFGFAAKPAIIKARVFDPNAPKEEAPKASEEKNTKEEAKASVETASDVPAADPKEFLDKVFDAMNMKVNIAVETVENEMNIELSGDVLLLHLRRPSMILVRLTKLTVVYRLSFRSRTKEWLRSY